MKIIFFGSDDFAAAHLDFLIKGGHDIAAVVTPPDKARGRGMKTAAGPVKQLARQSGLKVLQPENVNDKKEASLLRGFGTELFVVIAYGKILSPEVLSIPKIMPVNVHSSLLPQYRGAAPINWAIINGETVTGISIIKMVKKMDAGEIINQINIPIEPHDTSVTLRERMKEIGPPFLLETIDLIRKGTAKFTAQNEKHVSFASKLSKDLSRIDWFKSAQQINNQIRGLQPWPGAWASYNGKMLKILEAEVVPASGGRPGDIASVAKDSFNVTTQEKALKIKKVHLESSRPMSAAEFLIGYKIREGDRLE